MSPNQGPTWNGRITEAERKEIHSERSAEAREFSWGICSCSFVGGGGPPLEILIRIAILVKPVARDSLMS